MEKPNSKIAKEDPYEIKRKVKQLSQFKIRHLSKNGRTKSAKPIDIIGTEVAFALLTRKPQFESQGYRRYSVGALGGECC